MSWFTGASPRRRTGTLIVLAGLSLAGCTADPSAGAEPTTGGAIASGQDAPNLGTNAGGTSLSTTSAVPYGGGVLPDLASGVAREEWLVDEGALPESTAWEPSGNFRTFCSFSHLAWDDPIAYAREPGAAHLHMFFGNTAVDAHSTYRSLRTSGDSTCQGGQLNRSGYWIPAVLDVSDQVVVPEYFLVYYKGNGTEAMIRDVRPNPNGLRMIAGFNMDGPTTMQARWSCVGHGQTSITIPSCPAGQELKVELRFPMCWNGRDTDAPDHRSHMAYGTGGGGWVTDGNGCPSSHPVHLPELTLVAMFESDGNTDQWYLSSDRTPGMPAHPNGSTLHADWFGAWENDVQETWTAECINEMRSCVSGELGDGTRLIDLDPYSGPRRIDPPPR